MIRETKAKSRKIRRDVRTLRILAGIYCRDHHQKAIRIPDSGGLCVDCNEFVNYAAGRLARCPLDPKPACRDCHIHCFAPAHRETARRIMRYGWPRIIRRGRIDLLWQLLTAGRENRKQLKETGPEPK